MKTYGKMRLLLNLGERPEGAFDVARFPAATGDGYDRFVLPLVRGGLGRFDALLSRDLSEQIAICVSYPNGVISTQPLRYTDRAAQKRESDCSSVVESALAVTQAMSLCR